MTRNEYEQRKRRLDEQLRAGIELLEAAHRQQVRALELVWMTTAEEDLPPSQELLRKAEGTFSTETAQEARASGPVEPQRRTRRRAWQLIEEVEEILGSLPEVFDRNHVIQALGYKPDRGSLYRVLDQLAKSGVLSVQSLGAGKVATKYRRTGASASPDA